MSSLAFAQRAGSPSHTYLGFDRNGYPGDNQLAALRNTFAFTGYWLNNPPGETTNSWQGKRQRLRDAGFGFLVLFNGRTYAQIRGGNPSVLGKNEGQSAARTASREGFPRGAIIFLDQEEGGRLLPEQRAYLHAWIDAVIASGYRAGVYCSGVPFKEGNGTVVITAEDIQKNAGGRTISFWVSHDGCPPSPGCRTANPPAPGRSGVPFAEVWQFAQSPRRKDMTVSCAKTYSSDGECYAPGIPQKLQLHVDLSSANSPDPSHGR
jgi:hypothetical protein